MEYKQGVIVATVTLVTALSEIVTPNNYLPSSFAQAFTFLTPSSTIPPSFLHSHLYSFQSSG